MNLRQTRNRKSSLPTEGRNTRQAKIILGGAILFVAWLGWPLLTNALDAAVVNSSKLIVRKGDSACAILQQDLNTLEKPKLPGVPDWKESDVDLSSQLGYTQEADFDFFNHGKIDRVFMFSYAAHTVQGSKVLVQPGSSFSSVRVPFKNPLDDPDTRFYPCQLVSKDILVKDCSPLGFYHNNDTVSVYKSKTSSAATFLVDFSEVVVVRLDGITYVLLSAVYSKDAGVTAVFRPKGNEALDLVCVLHQGVDFIG